MDVDNVRLQEKGMSKGIGRPKGKEKGKGKEKDKEYAMEKVRVMDKPSKPTRADFQCTCRHCGKVGYKWIECLAKDGRAARQTNHGEEAEKQVNWIMMVHGCDSASQMKSVREVLCECGESLDRVQSQPDHTQLLCTCPSRGHRTCSLHSWEPPRESCDQLKHCKSDVGFGMF